MHGTVDKAMFFHVDPYYFVFYTYCTFTCERLFLLVSFTLDYFVIFYYYYIRT